MYPRRTTSLACVLLLLWSLPSCGDGADRRPTRVNDASPPRFSPGDETAAPPRAGHDSRTGVTPANTNERDGNDDPPGSSVPEPATMLLVGSGAIAVGLRNRSKKRRITRG